MDATDILYRALREASGGVTPAEASRLASDLLPRSGEELRESLGIVAKNLEGLTAVSQIQADAVGSNTQAVLQNTVAQTSGGVKSAASAIGKFATGILGTGLGLAPAISAITKLFGGGKGEEPPPLVRYTAPPPLIIEATNPKGAITGSSWAAGPMASGIPAGTEQIKQEAAPAAPQITIQVQAMDSRSFLDHSGEIARAVREAMLNMHSLNDVINDL